MTRNNQLSVLIHLVSYMVMSVNCAINSFNLNGQEKTPISITPQQDIILNATFSVDKRARVKTQLGDLETDQYTSNDNENAANITIGLTIQYSLLPLDKAILNLKITLIEFKRLTFSREELGTSELNLILYNETIMTGLLPPGEGFYKIGSNKILDNNGTNTSDNSNISLLNTQTSTVYHVYEIRFNAENDVTLLPWTNPNADSDDKWFVMSVFYALNNIIMTSNLAVVNSEQDVQFTFETGPASTVPMGNASVQVQYSEDRTVEELTAFPISKQRQSISWTTKFSTQGNYTVNITISSALNSINYTVSVRVWDDLNAIQLVPVPEAILVNQTTSLVFRNVLKSGFLFDIDYSRGTYKQENNSVFQMIFTAPTLELSYSDPGEYTISLKAWNPYYIRQFASKLYVQDPVTNMSITPSSLIIPFTDTLVTFTLTMLEDEESPTSASCLVQPPGLPALTVNLDISYGRPFNFTVDFQTTGIYNVRITCSNKVSSLVIYTAISVRMFSSVNFKIIHNHLIPTNYSEPVTNSFQIMVLNIEIVPSFVELEWNFGDNSPILVTKMTKFIYQHEFPTRGEFSVNLLVRFNGATSSVTVTQQIGIVTYTISSYLKLNNVDLTLTPSILDPGNYSEPIQYEINYADGSSPTSDHVHAYAEYGQYYPVIKAYNSTLVEFRRADQYIQIEHRILQLVPVHAAKISYPSGILHYQITIPTGHLYLPFIKCQVRFGDDIDKEIVYITGNLTASAPFQIHYQYLTLGVHDINLTCSNLLTSLSVSSQVEVENDCFSINGIFDRQYAYKTNPMRSYRSYLVQLTNRMTVFCVNNTQKYTWKMEQLDTDPEKDVPLIQPEKDFIEFPIRSVAPGLYRLTMNASFTDLYYRWFIEATYLEYTNPPLRAEIAGGFIRVNGRTDVNIDAESLSYDPLFDVADGGLDKLIFSWSCERIPSNSVVELQAMHHNMSMAINCTDVATLISPGIFVFRGSEQTIDVGYKFEVTVSKIERKTSSFTQLIQVKEDAPQMSIFCIINCEKKVAMSSSLSLESICNNCQDNELERASFEWSLSRYDENSFEYVKINNFTHMTEPTGDNPSTIVFKKEVFQVDFSYRIAVIVHIEGRGTPGFASYTILINMPPYDGNCIVNPTNGVATKTKFRVICENWKDEGFRRNRSPNLDKDEPLTYKYFIKNGDFINPLVSGVESTSPEINVPIFPGVNGTDYYIITHVFDILQDYQQVALEIQLESPFADQGNASEVEKIDKLINDNEQNLREVNLTGSSAKFTREVNSVISVIQSVDIPEDEYLLKKFIEGDSSTQSLSWTEIWSDFNTPRDDRTKNRVASSGEVYMETLLRRKNDVKSLNGQGVAALAQTMTNLVFKPSTTKLETAKSGSGMVEEISQRLQDIINTRPFPIKDNIEDAISGVTDFMDHLLLASVPDLRGRLAEVSKDAIREEVQATNGSSERISEDEATEMRYRFANFESLEIEKKKAASRTMINSLETSLHKNHEALSATMVKGQNPKKIVKKNIQLQSQKLGPQDLQDKGIDTGDFTIQLPQINQTINNVSEVLSIQSTMFKTNPFTWGTNGSSYGIDSSVLMLDIKSSQNQSVNTSIELSIKKQSDVVFKEIDADSIVKNDGLHFHQTKLKNTREALYIFLKMAEKYDNITAFFKLEKVPSSLDHTYATSAELINLNGAVVYRLYVPSKTFSESGTVIFGLWLKPMSETVQRVKRSLPDQSNTTTPSLQDNTTITANTTNTTNTANAINPVKTQNYQLYVSTDACLTWNAELQTWDAAACEVSKYSTPYRTLCTCYNPPGNSFASSFYVPPNTIDFSTVFSKFDASNASVYGTVIATFVVYALTVIWARRKDNKDQDKWKLGFLKDNVVNDEYMYLISVETGIRKRSGCKSNIYFIMSGDLGDSGNRCLGDDERYLDTGSVMNFICTNNGSLGDLTYLRLWHDNSGFDHWASWYCVKVIIEDLQTKKKYIFLVNNWLAVDKGDCMLERVIPVTKESDLLAFNQLFPEHQSSNLTDSHIWLSVLYRPARSYFTRVQRVSCCLAFLYLTMITNAMFYKSDGSEEKAQIESNALQIGVFRLSLSVIYISFISTLITLPPTMLIIYLFRLSRPASTKIHPDHKSFAKSRCRSCCCRRNKNIDNSSSMESIINESMDDVQHSETNMQLNSQDNDQVFALGQKPLNGVRESSSGGRESPNGGRESSNAEKNKSTDVLTKSQENTEEIKISGHVEPRTFSLNPIAPGYPLPSSQITTFKEPVLVTESPLPLPHGCVYLAYMLVIAAVLLSAFFAILYSQQWGKSLSEEWLSTFFLGFFENVFLIDPVKIVVISVIFSLCSKNPYDKSIKVNVTTAKEEADKKSKGNIFNIISPPEPITEEHIQQLKDRRIEEAKAQMTLIKLILYGIFLIGLVVVSLANRDGRSFQYKHHIENSVYTNSFDQIRTHEDMFKWLFQTLVPVSFPQTRYTGQKISWQEQLMYSDLVNLRVGPVRLRQIRTEKRPTPFYGRRFLKLMDERRDYYWHYTQNTLDTTDYCLGWNSTPCSQKEKFLSVTSTAWHYQSGNSEQSVGQIDSYGDEGYVADLSINRDVSLQKLNELYSNGWLDRSTKALFVDFSLYNVNTNLNIAVRLIAEIPDFGSVVTWFSIDTMRLFQDFGSIGVVSIICEVILVIIMVLFIIKFVKSLVKQKLKYFNDFWNLVDAVTVLMSLIVTVFYALRRVYVDETLSRFRVDPKKFVDFSFITTWDSTYVCCMGMLLFITIIGLLKLLGYNKRMNTIGIVLKNCARDLGSMAIIFFIMLSAYIISGYVLLHTHRDEYKSIWSATISTLVYIVGQNKLGRSMLSVSDSALYSVYYMVFVFFVIFVLLTMFQAILNNSITVVRADINKRPAPYGITDVLKNVYQSLIGDWLPSSSSSKSQIENDNQNSNKNGSSITRNGDNHTLRGATARTVKNEYKNQDMLKRKVQTVYQPRLIFQ